MLLEPAVDCVICCFSVRCSADVANLVILSATCCVFVLSPVAHSSVHHWHKHTHTCLMTIFQDNLGKLFVLYETIWIMTLRCTTRVYRCSHGRDVYIINNITYNKIICGVVWYYARIVSNKFMNTYQRCLNLSCQDCANANVAPTWVRWCQNGPCENAFVGVTFTNQ